MGWEFLKGTSMGGGGVYGVFSRGFEGGEWEMGSEKWEKKKICEDVISEFFMIF